MVIGHISTSIREERIGITEKPYIDLVKITDFRVPFNFFLCVCKEKKLAGRWGLLEILSAVMFNFTPHTGSLKG